MISTNRPVEAAKPEAPVIRAWNDDDGTQPGRWSWFDPQGNRTYVPYSTQIYSTNP